MRKQINFGTYQRVKQIFEENPNKLFSQTSIRDELDIDYYSVKIALSLLSDDGIIKEEKEKYKLNETSKTKIHY